MTAPLSDLTKLHARQMDGLRRKNERELKFIENSHDSMKVEQKKQNEAEIVDLQHEHHKQIANENAKKEKLLESMKSHLNQTQDMTEKQLKELEVEKAKEQNQLASRYSTQRERLVQDNELYMEEINNRFNNKTNEVLHHGRNRVETMELAQRDAYAQKDHEYQVKMDDQRQNFTQKYKTDEQNFNSIKENQNKVFKKERLSQNVRQNQELEKMNQTHNFSKEKKQTEFKRDVASQENFFEKRYTDVRNKHEADFQRLNDLNKKIVEKSKAELVKEISLQETRSKDPFFEFVELRPTLTETEDGVKISVPIPERSKGDLMLSVNNKDVLLSFNRRYKDVTQTAQGESRIDKVESLSSKVKTAFHLDAKSVKASYEGGAMTYTIKKA